MHIETLESGAVIFWDDKQDFPAPRATQPNRTDSHVAVSCCDCGEKRYVKAYDARRAARCYVCQKANAGHASYVKLVRKYGKRIAQEKILKNIQASWAEKVVALWLDKLGHNYDSNIVFDTNPADDSARWYVLDFQLKCPHGKARNAAIEVNGWGHKLPRRQARDRALETDWQGHLLIVTTDEIKADAKAAFEKVADFCLTFEIEAWLGV